MRGKRGILSSVLVQNLTRLLTANVLTQLIGLLTYPLITRLYSQEDFGLFSLFTSIGGVATLVATADYQYAILLPKENKKSVALMGVCLMLLLVFCLFLSLTVSFKEAIAAVFRTPDLTRYYWLLPLYVLLMGLWNILNYSYLRCSMFGQISNFQVSRSVLSALGKVVFGLLGRTGVGLPAATLLGQFGSIGLTLAMGRAKIRQYWEKVSWCECRSMAVEYANFPKFSLPRGVVNYVFGQMPVFLLTPAFGTHQIGLWSMALLLAFTPINIIAQTLNQVFFQRMTEWVNGNVPIYGKLLKLLLLMLVATIPILGGLYFFLPWLTELFLGSGWRETGYLIRWMMPWLIIMLLMAPVGELQNIFGQQKRGLFFELLLGGLRTLGVFLGLWLHNFTTAIAGYAVASFMVNFAQYVWLLSLARRFDQSLKKSP